MDDDMIFLIFVLVPMLLIAGPLLVARQRRASAAKNHDAAQSGVESPEGR